MKRNLFLSLLLAGAATATQADEARLLRFPATNGQEVVFTYAGDLYKAPLAGGEAQRLTSARRGKARTATRIKLINRFIVITILMSELLFSN